MRRAGVIAAALVTSLATSAHAYRPFDGTDADVSGTGEIELEIAPLGYLRSQHDSAVVFANTIFNYGFIPRWELVLEAAGLFDLKAAPPPRFIDGGAFLKHVLREGSLQDKRGISLAAEFGVLFPTNDTPGADDGGVYLGMIASQAWSELIMHVNATISRSTDKQPDFFLGSIFEFHPRARIRPVSEIFIERHGDQTIPSILVGAIFQAFEHLSFDAATRLSWTNDAPLFELRVGLTWTIPLHKRHPHPHDE